MTRPRTKTHKIHPEAAVFTLVALGILGLLSIALLATGRCFPEF